MSKCAECGFLALRLKVTRELVDAEQSTRATGQLPHIPPSGFFGDNLGSGITRGEDFYDDLPICFAQQVDFSTDDECMGLDPHYDKRHEVLTRDRDCDRFTPWRIGYTPKEHAEMLHAREMMERQAELDRERDERLQRMRQEDIDLSERRHRETLRLTALVAFLGGAFTIFGVFVTKWLGLLD